jgi:hypothetical protein
MSQFPHDISEDTVREAVDVFGRDMVATVLLLVDTSDPDGAMAFFEDMELEEEAECLRMLYFEI